MRERDREMGNNNSREIQKQGERAKERENIGVENGER
jgi:hypothetical protein